ncbi:hypothetical protein GCK32_019366 [Trichostrongylus colubriformis]|uniref:Uncharacterized protein n=1 Tax=Trichostrongylus colubriformis TaxID=6319 RepID=A0AAN8IXV4_TRICO
MQETLYRLFNLAAVLVYFSYMCIPMPLRNSSITRIHTSHTTRTPDVNHTANLTSFHFHSSDLSQQPGCSTYITTEMVRLTTQAHVTSTAPTTIATSSQSIADKSTITYGELLSKLHSATSWIKDFGQKVYANWYIQK